MLDSEWDDDGFVSVNLDSSRCDICHLDTGEDLVPCGICRQEVANAYTRTGFNELPAHANMQAHKGCLWKEHQMSQLTSRYNPYAQGTPICSNPVRTRTNTANMFDLMTGGSNTGVQNSQKYCSKSQPAIVNHQLIQSPIQSHRRTTIGLGVPSEPPTSPNSGQRYSKGTNETNKDAFNSKLQRLIRKAKNKETVENRRNGADLCTRSNPGSRSPSPVLIRDVEKQTFGSEKNLSSVQKDADPKYMSLKQRYTKYLFGKSKFTKPSFFGKRKQSAPQLNVPASNPASSTPSNQSSKPSHRRTSSEGDLKVAVDKLRNISVVDGHGNEDDYKSKTTQFNNNSGRRVSSGNLLNGPKDVELTVITPVKMVDEEPIERAKEDCKYLD